ncbi:histidine phosphatase family protein [Granulicatella sp. zg-ZJ]|uniref:histidine phosphatase family protein n=1 Tax=unclassified Granulicatella TaxID=2630493 RepID=UPI0013C292F7|nr:MULTISPECIES: histidine phosphatase family protein [unclassified Granulicatella]MBS4749693.1 histidine phosphatase family protein [Carnobacteriaceae bacterium zg-ZUI78]NEW61822.1 histidine phosphatase family protein [Granulicatella sp. zg-ZJ]NEW65896.1 histidine phosphatase family protein [Granulicatella sp. zg-84]QMI85125.1 histidine phosphatase family protein [Carnobacteriaceae bacterium zg-84]
MKVYMMRHGETDYNKARCFYGSADVSINDTGKQQAHRIKDIMADYPVDKIYISTLKRTYETASIIFENQVFDTVKGFDEKGFGQWEGLNADQIQATYPEEWQAWLEAPFEVTPPLAEPFTQFQHRVWEAFDRILKAHQNDSIAIVAHLGVLRLLYQSVIDKDAVFWNIDFPQGTVTCFENTHSNEWESYLITRKEA